VHNLSDHRTYSIPQYCKIVGINEATGRAWVKRGQIPSVLIRRALARAGVGATTGSGFEDSRVKKMESDAELLDQLSKIPTLMSANGSTL
jgi:hypothetical protein